MNRRTTMIAGALALALAAGAPAAAQQQGPPASTRAQPPEAEVAEAAAILFEKFEVLREGLGIEAPLLPQEALASALLSAVPVFPSDDPSLSWSSGFAFDFKTDTTTGELAPDEDGRTVFTDARACLQADEIAEVVHFQRFTRGDVRGHRCITSFAGASGEDVWVLQSRTFAEGPRRRLTAFYAVATAIEGDQDLARRGLEERLDQNVALAGIMADYALAMFLQKEASSDPLTMENLPERLARLQERLAELAAPLEAPTPASAP